MNESTERNPKNVLPLSLRFAKEYFEMLCEMRRAYTEDQIQESKELTICQRALWTALIIEVGRLCDTYHANGKDVISYKKVDHLKSDVNKFHGEAIIGKIINTRKTFTAHWSKKKENVVSIAEICSSNLGVLLKQLSELSV